MTNPYLPQTATQLPPGATALGLPKTTFAPPKKSPGIPPMENMLPPDPMATDDQYFIVKDGQLVPSPTAPTSPGEKYICIHNGQVEERTVGDQVEPGQPDIAPAFGKGTDKFQKMEEKGEPKMSAAANAREEAAEKKMPRHASGTDATPATQPTAGNGAKFFKMVNGQYVEISEQQTFDLPVGTPYWVSQNGRFDTRTAGSGGPGVNDVSPIPSAPPAKTVSSGGHGPGLPPPVASPPPSTNPYLPNHQPPAQKAAAMANNGAGSWGQVNENNYGGPPPAAPAPFPIGMTPQPDATGYLASQTPQETPLQFAPDGSVLQSNASLNMDPTLRYNMGPNPFDIARDAAKADGTFDPNPQKARSFADADPTKGRPSIPPPPPDPNAPTGLTSGAVAPEPEFLPDGTRNPKYNPNVKRFALGTDTYASRTTPMRATQNPYAPPSTGQAGLLHVPAQQQSIQQVPQTPTVNVNVHPQNPYVPQPATQQPAAQQEQQAAQQGAASAQPNPASQPITAHHVVLAQQAAGGNQAALSQLISDLGINFGDWETGGLHAPANLVQMMQAYSVGNQQFTPDAFMAALGAQHSAGWYATHQPAPTPAPSPTPTPTPTPVPAPPPVTPPSPANVHTAQLALQAATGNMGAVSQLEHELGVQGSLDTSHVNWQAVALHLQRAAAGLEPFNPNILHVNGAVTNQTQPYQAPHQRTPAEQEAYRQQQAQLAQDAWVTAHPGVPFPGAGRREPVQVRDGVSRNPHVPFAAGGGNPANRYATGTDNPYVPTSAVTTTPPPPPPGPQTITYDDWKSLPALAYLHGDISAGQLGTFGQRSSAVPALGLTGGYSLPAPGQTSISQYNNLARNPDTWASTESVYRAGNRDLQAERDRRFNSLAFGNATPTTAIRTR